MAKNSFINSAELNYPRKEIFKVFKKQIKQDFPKFNEKEAIGTSTKKKIGHYATKTAEAFIEITDYKEDEVYEITTTTSQKSITFYSRYTLEEIDANTTRLTLEESQAGYGFFVTINHAVQSIFFKKRIKQRFSFLIQSLESEIIRMQPKTKATPNIEAPSQDDSVLEIKEKENITE
ncbi:MAG: DUF3284 domain-containing protein [Sarcina sp.]